MRFAICAAIFVSSFFVARQQACADSWRAGAASAIITPDEWLPMAGYASRDRPADGKVTELHAKVGELRIPILL